MEEWKEYRLGDVCTELSDGLHKAPKFVLGGEYIFVNAKNIINGYIVDNDPTKKTTYEEYLKYSSPLNDTTILYSIDGTIGNVALYRGEKCVLGKGACYINPNANYLDRLFFYYELKSPRFKAYIDKMSTGSTIKHISLKTMREYVFTCPNLDTQKKISSILKSLDDKIENNRKINENLEQHAQALFKSWFVDFEPFRDQPFVESELGMIPEGWRVGTIISISKQVTDGVHNSVKDEPKSNYLLLSAKNIKNGELNISSNERRIDKDVFNQLRRRTKLSKGDILITSVGTIGEMLLLKEDPTNYEFQRSVAIIKPNDEIVTSEYVYLSLKSRLNDVKHMAHGAVQQCIFIGDMKDFKILIAPYFDILAFSSIVKPFYDQIKLNQAESHRLSHLRDTLLPKLMSGEIKL